MLSGSSPIFALSNHITCSQTQTGATVSLNSINAALNLYLGVYTYRVFTPFGHNSTIEGGWDMTAPWPKLPLHLRR